MHDLSSCDPHCSGSGLGSCSKGATQQPITIQDALARFEREASPGVCDTGRYRMPYFTWGEGPPLVFIHGVADISRSFILVMSQLASRFRCVGYNLPSGHDDGARLGRYRHDDLIDDLWALLDHLNLTRSYVLGSSFGSTIALRAMRQRPERLPRGIMQGGLARRPLRPLERWFGLVARWMPGPTARIPRRHKILNAVHRAPFAPHDQERWDAFVNWTGQARLAALGHQVRLLHDVDLRPDLPHIQQPVLLLHGDRDAVMPRPHADMLLQGLPRAGLVILEGAGHVPCYSHPEAMAAVVRQFLTPPGQEPSPCPGRASCSGPTTSTSE